ncbi:gas vesicle protein [Algihabitans albus]|uniref:gas vesicle protein n=1 Tax=Algihabitans albus TaxID=2164067 RepID=UPI000E5C89CA|nr:gas vesicle protein [Algihabitans albus]
MPVVSDIQTPAQRLVLAELLDRALTKGVVLRGDAVISVAGIDLLYLGLKAVLASTDTLDTFLSDAKGEERDLSLRSL